MENRFLRLPQVMAQCGLSRAMIYLLISQRQFPRQVVIGPRAVAWLESEVEAWIKACVDARDAGEHQGEAKCAATAPESFAVARINSKSRGGNSSPRQITETTANRRSISQRH